MTKFGLNAITAPGQTYSVKPPINPEIGAPIVGTLVYCQVEDQPDGSKIYSGILVVKKGSKDYEAMRDLYRMEVDRSFAGKLPPGAWNPLRDGDEKRPDGEFLKRDPAFRDAIYTKVKTRFAPKVINRHGEAMSFEDIRSGDRVAVQVKFWSFKNKLVGISASLGNILYIEAGRRIGGGANPQEQFAGILQREDVRNAGEAANDGSNNDLLLA